MIPNDCLPPSESMKTRGGSSIDNVRLRKSQGMEGKISRFDGVV